MEPERPKGPFTVTLAAAPTDEAKCTYFSFEKNEVVKLTDKEASESDLWDFATIGLSGRTNGGESGKGEAAVYRTGTTDFDHLVSAEEYIANANLWYSDQLSTVMYLSGAMPPPLVTIGVNRLLTDGGWLRMDFSEMPPRLKLDPNVYILRTAKGEYVKLQLISATEGGHYGHFSFRYDFISDKGSNDKLQPAEGERVIEGKEAVSVLLPKAEATKVRLLVIKGKDVSQKDLDYIRKEMPRLEQLDLTSCTLAIDPFDKGFKDNKTLKRLILPRNLVTIGKGQLSYTGLEEVIFPGNKLENIGAGAFAFSNKLRTVKLPESILVIEKEAFAYMSGLKYLTIPKSVVTIPTSCFAVDKSLVSVVFEGAPKMLGKWAFRSCVALREMIFKSPTPPQIPEKYSQWPFVEGEYWTEKDGKTPRLQIGVPKGSVEAYIKAWKPLDESDKKFFVEL